LALLTAPVATLCPQLIARANLLRFIAGVIVNPIAAVTAIAEKRRATRSGNAGAIIARDFIAAFSRIRAVRQQIAVRDTEYAMLKIGLDGVAMHRR
jgi:hypothetical protein